MSSLYLHIPFCCRKCPYCDFYSTVGSAEQLEEYVELLCRHLQLLYQQQPEPVALETIFFGGGTPSLLTVAQVKRILKQLKGSFGVAVGAEISLEANPGTLDAEKLRGYRAAGITRLSLGVQSLRDDQLQLLGRIHSAGQAKAAVTLARRAGFDNLSLDLMFNLPGQDCRALEQELQELLALQPQHLALYGLSIEEGTEFAARQRVGSLRPIADEEAAAQYLLLHERLQQAGYEHYEISNFARPGFRCRHNQVYWRRGDCLAVGCGAHSFFARSYGERWAVPVDLARYRRRLQNGEEPAELLERFDRHGAMAETLYLALRTSDGISRSAFQKEFGVTPETAFPIAFRRLKEVLRRQGDRWSFAPQSWLLFDTHIIHFL